MLRFCFLGIAFLAAFNLSVAEDYEIETDGSVNAAHHLIPDSKPLHFIDSSSVGKFSIVDFINPMTSVIPSVNPITQSDATKTMTNSSCLTLVLADNLKEHITPDNLQPVTVLLQHSLESCPGLKSTFEILQKMMDIKGMNIDEAIEFVQKLTIIQGKNKEGQEVEHETSEVKNKNVTPTKETDVDNSESVHDPSTTEEPFEEENHHITEVAENDETNVEPSEAPELYNTNPLDLIQSVLSMLEKDPQYSSFLTDNYDETGEENIEKDSVPDSDENHY